MLIKKERFISVAGLPALAVGHAYGIDPKILLAIAALETGWGEAVLGNNYFNIKGNDIETTTTEYIDSKPKKIRDKFRAYANPLESFMDFMRLILTNPRYELARYLFHSPGDFFVALQKAGYATDPMYAVKCMATYNSIPEDWLDILWEYIKE